MKSGSFYRKEERMINEFHRRLKDIECNKVPYNASSVTYWKECQGILKKLEAIFKTRVISFYISSLTSLSEIEATQLYHHLRLIGPVEKLTLIIYGYGGSGIAAYRIVNLLRKYAKQIDVVIPEIAASAMTMLSFGADKIWLSPISVLSPIDTSISGHPLAPKSNIDGKPVSVEITQLQKYLELISIDKRENLEDFNKTAYADLSKYVHPIFLGTLRRSVSLSDQLLRGILKTHIADPKLIDQIAAKINDDFPSHSYPLLGRDLEAMGLQVEELNPAAVQICSELFSLYHSAKDGWTTVKNDIKEIGRRYTFIESRGLRSYYLFQEDSKLNEKDWVSLKRSSGYEHCSYYKKAETDFYEVKLLNAIDFKELFQEVEEAKEEPKKIVEQ